MDSKSEKIDESNRFKIFRTGEGKRIRVDQMDNTIYDWDDVLKAWFPRITEDQIAAFQNAYSYSENQDYSEKYENEDNINNKMESQNNDEILDINEFKNEISNIVSEFGEKYELLPETTRKKILKASTKKPAKTKAVSGQNQGWFEMDEKKNCNVYISGLPNDITIDELNTFMSKCGIIMLDEATDKPKIKLYKDKDGNIKGDGLVCYLKPESVDLAIKILDGSTFTRGSNIISVSQAKFEVKGQYDPSRRKRSKKNKKKNIQEKALDWVDRSESSKHMKHLKAVVLHNIFDINEIKSNAGLIIDVKNQLRTIGLQFGKVRKIMLFENNPEGICSLLFETTESADQFLNNINHKKFNGRRIQAHIWDGITDYNLKETKQELESRLHGWEKYLERDDTD